MRSIITFCLVAAFVSTLETTPVPSGSQWKGEKIVGGSDTTIDLYPHLVSIRENGTYNCGGTILTETKILTAAHCFRLVPNMSAYSIRAGSTFIFGGASGQEIRVSRGFHHPRHSEGFGLGDVGILFLVDSLVFGHNVRPIQLPPQNASVPYGVRTPMAGWGAIDREDITSFPNVLQHTTLLIVTNAECNRPTSYNGSVRAEEVCAGPMEGGQGVCKGDSGSPLVVNGVQYGIASWGQDCALPNFPGVFTRVSFYSDWIHSIV